ncbi:hypothetical protein BJ170DRAFT_598955 [Xylariales sp. AK1849]|nr:hypothetical protein BJ170DRAFT_598955 [Xylariales sp. AK1849]
MTDRDRVAGADECFFTASSSSWRGFRLAFRVVARSWVCGGNNEAWKVGSSRIQRKLEQPRQIASRKVSCSDGSPSPTVTRTSQDSMRQHGLDIHRRSQGHSTSFQSQLGRPSRQWWKSRRGFSSKKVINLRFVPIWDLTWIVRTVGVKIQHQHLSASPQLQVTCCPEVRRADRIESALADVPRQRKLPHDTLGITSICLPVGGFQNLGLCAYLVNASPSTNRVSFHLYAHNVPHTISTSSMMGTNLTRRKWVVTWIPWDVPWKPARS